jgi:hypothetical protein
MSRCPKCGRSATWSARWRQCSGCGYDQGALSGLKAARQPPATNVTQPTNVTRRGFGSGSGREKVHGSPAEKQRAYRVRKKEDS